MCVCVCVLGGGEGVPTYYQRVKASRQRRQRDSTTHLYTGSRSSGPEVESHLSRVLAHNRMAALVAFVPFLLWVSFGFSGVFGVPGEGSGP